MKKVILLIPIFFATAFFSQSLKAQSEAQRIELCAKMTQGATFISSYTAQLAAALDGQRAPVFRQGILMTKGNRYRFTICTDDDSAGEAIIQILNAGRVMGSNVTESGELRTSIDIECQKTDAYVIVISIKDGRDGSAVSILSHVRTL